MGFVKRTALRLHSILGLETARSANAHMPDLTLRNSLPIFLPLQGLWL
jgi:hypothetical protein